MKIVNRLRTIAPLMVGATFVILAALERQRPLRPEPESKCRHVSRNLVFAGLAAMTVNLVERPIVQPLARVVEQRRWGLLYGRRLPRPLHIALAVVLLDYTLYIWHVLVHHVPWLWRFHLAHHVDLDLDASTALRFHFGELVLSIPWRAVQIVGIGVPPNALRLWQNALLISILFHHSNVKLPIAVERAISRIIVTPRIHGIHHSIVLEETESNWSSGLRLWDWLHGTLRLNVPQEQIMIGVPSYRDPDEVTLVRTLELPFSPQRPWRNAAWRWRVGRASDTSAARPTRQLTCSPAHAWRPPSSIRLVDALRSTERFARVHPGRGTTQTKPLHIWRGTFTTGAVSVRSGANL